MTRYFSLCGALLASTMLAPMPAFAQQDAADADTVTDVVVIRGTHIPEPQRRTSQVATFIQNEDLQRQGDGDAAIALTRLSGLSIVSGRFAYVRGLGERYSLALLNGSPLPSPEPAAPHGSPRPVPHKPPRRDRGAENLLCEFPG